MKFAFLKFILRIMMITLAMLPSFSIAGDKLTIYTVNYPLKYFAERIAGDYATVVFPAPADVDPAYWMPDRRAISEYQKADLILLNGAHYAKWTEKVTLPRFKMIDTSRKFKDRYIKTKEAVKHNHGPGGKHAHENIAFTVWLDFDLAVRQAQSIKIALIRKRPDHESAFEHNYAALKKDLMTLDGEMKEIVSKINAKPLIASHPVYDYLSQRYELKMRSVHWEPDERPGDAQWMELKNMLKGHHAQWMIWESQPLSETKEQLKSLGIMSIVFDPCGAVPEQGDFLLVMRRNIENLRAAY
ncbi:MAG: zinc ABC transporter substrate-binding protein [Nitrospiraceae bacterium]|nr:MAG: zinc ABC transporter substrate-binding protein [Nitrospiraceae bacterium]